ncbi:MAG: 5-bromo-4-chloroindolyl phosphate hydrolysis family protein [Clostridiales bacterium]|nr:5-bromo-4-chloroindolyl phosphate hydrolysis family protein [Clostridiales bacterium]
MNNNEFEDLGDKISDIIENAVGNRDYSRLNEQITRTVNRAIDNGSGALKRAMNSAFGQGYTSEDDSGDPYGQDRWERENPEHNARAYETHKEHGYQQPPFGRGQDGPYTAQRTRRQQKARPAVYGNTTGERAKDLVLVVGGGLLAGGLGLGFLGLLFLGGVMGWLPGGALLVVGVGTLAGVGVCGAGVSGLGRLKRFGRYVQALGEHTYCNFEQLSRAAGKPVRYVIDDVKKMIDRGWFLEGHVDQQETCLITSNETYQQYMETWENLKRRQQEQERRKQEEDPRVGPRGEASAEVREVLDRGNEYLMKIRRSNDAIPGEEISAKISRMELIVQKIFERAAEHPEIIPDLKRLMDYYLPMTVKLLDAYEDMDRQPVQGENIRSSKKEIEDTLDTLNTAFEKLLDSVFRDTAWDVSSDISVLHTILAQEGLTEDDFQKMKRETEHPTI